MCLMPTIEVCSRFLFKYLESVTDVQSINANIDLCLSVPFIYLRLKNAGEDEYIRSGFLTLQHWIDKTYIRLVSGNKDIFKDVSVRNESLIFVINIWHKIHDNKNFSIKTMFSLFNFLSYIYFIFFFLNA